MGVEKMSTSYRWLGLGVLMMTLALGCANRNLPNAPDYSAEPQAEFGAPEVTQPSTPVRIMFAPPSRTKPAGGLSASKIEEKKIGARGGILTLSHQKTRATFLVPPRALKQPENLSMQVFGSGLDAIVEMGPSGLQFDRSCALTITFPAKGIDPDALGGYLLNDDGSTTEVPAKVIAKGKNITVILQVNHFSKYGWDNGE